MVDSPRDPGATERRGEAHGAGSDSGTNRDAGANGVCGTNATQDLVEGLSLLMSAATKALSSLERRDDQQQARSAATGLSAEDLTEMVDKGGRKILDLVSRMASELGNRGPTASCNGSDRSSTGGGESDRTPDARGRKDE